MAYFPVPFVKYHPTFAETKDDSDFKISKESGHFDSRSYSDACFVVSDLLLAYSKHNYMSTAMSPSIYTILSEYPLIQILRAIEPSLIKRWRYKNCSKSKNSKDCQTSNVEGIILFIS